jgi:hypothetical protein
LGRRGDVIRVASFPLIDFSYSNELTSCILLLLKRKRHQYINSHEFPHLLHVQSCPFSPQIQPFSLSLRAQTALHPKNLPSTTFPQQFNVSKGPPDPYTPHNSIRFLTNLKSAYNAWLVARRALCLWCCSCGCNGGVLYIYYKIDIVSLHASDDNDCEWFRCFAV